MVALMIAAILASQPTPARAIGRASVNIVTGAEVHFDRPADRRHHPLERRTIRGEDGIVRPALIVEFQ